MKNLVWLALFALSCQSGRPPAPKPAASGEARVGAKAGASARSGAAAAGKKMTAAERGEDVKPEFEKMNSSEYAKPPTKYREGHTKPRKLAANRIKKSAAGFEIHMPSGAPMTTPAVYGGMVITGGGFRSKELYAFDARSGDLRWGLSLDDDGPSAPACDQGVCVINTESCTVFAVQATTGELLWSKWLGDPLVSAPTIANGMVYASYPPTGGTYAKNAPAGKARPPGATHVLGAFDLRTGEIRWQKWIDADVMSAPVAVDTDVYATTFAGTVLRFNGSTGQILSARRDRATSAPVIAGESVYYTQRSEKAGQAAREGVASASRKTGGKRWVRSSKQAPYIDKDVQDKTRYALESAEDDAANGFGGAAPAAANASAAIGTVGRGRVASMQAFQGSRILNIPSGNVSSMGDEIVATDQESGERLWSYKLAGDLR